MPKFPNRPPGAAAPSAKGAVNSSGPVSARVPGGPLPVQRDLFEVVNGSSRRSYGSQFPVLLGGVSRRG
jgi:hypothetical protein